MIKEVNVQVVLTKENQEMLEILTTLFNSKRMTAFPLSEDDVLEVIISSQCFSNISKWLKSAEHTMQILTDR